MNQPQDESNQLADYYIPSITAALDILREFQKNTVDGPWTYYHRPENNTVRVVGTEWTPDNWPQEVPILETTIFHYGSLHWLTVMNPGIITILIQLMEDSLEALEHHAHPDEFNLIAAEPRELPCPYEMMMGQLAAKIVFAFQNLPNNETEK